MARQQHAEECFDVLNSEGVKTGEIVPRKQVHSLGFWHRAVHIWLFDLDSRRVLVQQRANCKDSNAGLFDVSCAGHLCSGENSNAAALSELHEELGLDGIIVKPASEDAKPTEEPEPISDVELAPFSDGNVHLYHICTLKRSAVLHEGKFIDNEVIDAYVGLFSASGVARKRQSDQLFVLQESEVQSVKFLELSDLVQQLREEVCRWSFNLPQSLTFPQQNPSFVRVPQLNSYKKCVFDIIEQFSLSVL